MRKNITLIGINFYPEDTAIGLYSTQMMQYLEEKGYEVNVLTGFPYYPQWSISEAYRNKPKYLKEQLNTIQILRYKQYVPSRPNFLKRVIHLTDFTIGTFFNLRKIKRTDVIIAVVPFTSTILLGWILKKRTNSKLWIHIQDFEFDAAVQSGISHKTSSLKKLLFKGLFRLEKFLLKKGDLGSSISFTMLRKLQTKSSIPTVYFPNWIDANKIDPSAHKIHSHLNSRKFKILYSGSIGDKQDWDLFVQLARELQQYEDVQIIIVGEGSKSGWLKEALIDNPIVQFHPPVPYEELSDLLCSADLHILLQKTDVLDTVMPSKLLGMMASARPSLITGNCNSEVKEVITKSKGGFYLDDSRVHSLTEVILDLKNNPEKSRQIGNDARKYIVDNFSKNKILQNFEKEIDQLIKGRDL